MAASVTTIPRLVVFASLAIILAILLFVRGSDGLYGEDGPVEIASVVAYLGAALAFVAAAPDLLGRLWQVPVTLLFAAGRELDLDKSLLSGGILKSRFYTGAFPLWEKLVGLAIVFFALWTGLRLIRHGAGPTWRAMRTGRLWPWLTVGALIALVIAKGFDGIGRKLRPLGIEVSQALNDRLAHVEEWLELGGAVAILLAVAVWAGRRARPT
ncbi:hypothetical protein [Jannaschia seohaensis]|uniref:Uncharacterized protein n=1 Tax=Jannaschia seohaensis TaxID=475081 RepID=A0A2Y9A2R8_9RHOB|nr:hypothetical protein [Jannaschia seohaensis]PWJ22513.1 hypothetical protein BCF38_101927 [Jannaschia seohaensis]SSA38791.1 hypothetical protein SAMN05421539_101927 [Jannaschia seohaensis]